VLSERPWFGYWVGKEYSKCDFSIAGDGVGSLMLKEKNKRITDRLEVKIHYFLEEKVKGKWVQRRLVEDGFETEQKATAKPKKVDFTATYTGGGQARFIQTFTSQGIEIAAKMVKKSDKAEEARVGVQVSIPSLFHGKGREEAIEQAEERLKGDKLRGVRSDNKKLSFDYHEDVDLAGEDVFGKGAESLLIDCSHFGKRKFELQNSVAKKGKILFDKTKNPFLGIKAKWYPEDEQGKATSSLFQISVR